MDLFQILVLALLQGFTEFLPVSSSAHLILVPVLTGWPDQGLAFDIAVHVGTLAAVLLYFRQDVQAMLRDWGRSLVTREATANSRLAWGIAIGTVPLGIAGLLFADVIETQLRSPVVIALATIAFAFVLWAAYAFGTRQRDEHSLRLSDILLIGIAQALALIPGTSRSGITITAGLMLGLTGTAAARFSFLLSIPAILLPGGLKVFELARSAVPVQWSVLVLGAAVSGVMAYFTIHLFLKLLDRVGMVPFVVYRLALGAVLLLVFY